MIIRNDSISQENDLLNKKDDALNEEEETEDMNKELKLIKGRPKKKNSQ
jgi:hypothetical protein